MNRYDLFVAGRAVIAGCVIVSAPGIYYKIWICMILGAIAGVCYVMTSVAL
jgi:hypothetical protein